MNIICTSTVRSLLLVLLSLCSCQSFAASITISAAQIEDMLKEQEPFAVVKMLRDGKPGQNWRDVMNQIKTGEPEWLNVALSLEKGVRKKGLYDLLDAVTRAIPENPAGVLHILSDKNYFLNEPNVCNLPIIPTTTQADRKFIQEAFDSVKTLQGGERCSELMQREIYGSHTPMEK